MSGKFKNNFPIVLFVFWVVIFIALVAYENKPKETNYEGLTLKENAPKTFTNTQKQTLANTELNTPQAQIKKVAPQEKKIVKISPKSKKFSHKADKIKSPPKINKRSSASKNVNYSQEPSKLSQDGTHSSSGNINSTQKPLRALRRERPIARKPRLRYIEIDGPNKILHSGQQYQFRAHGYDTDKSEVSFEEQWETDGGEITDRGLFRAGLVPGRFFIMVRDAQTYKRKRIYITIAEQITDIRIEGPSRALKTRERFHFKAYIYNQAEELTIKRIKWYAKGGVIDRNGYFTAGTRPGTFIVSVRIMGTRLRAQMRIKIEYRILPCPGCRGHGKKKVTCYSCDGRGWYQDKEKNVHDCQHCQKGYIFRRCRTCNGLGNIKK